MQLQSTLSHPSPFSGNLGPALACTAELAARRCGSHWCLMLLLAFPESLLLVQGLPWKRGLSTSVYVEVWCLAMGSYAGEPVWSNSGVWGCSASRIARRTVSPRTCMPVWGWPYGDCGVPRAWEELLHQVVWVTMTKQRSVLRWGHGIDVSAAEMLLSVESGAFKPEVTRLRPCLFHCNIQSQLEPESVKRGSQLFHSSELKPEATGWKLHHYSFASQIVLFYKYPVQWDMTFTPTHETQHAL